MNSTRHVTFHEIRPFLWSMLTIYVAVVTIEGVWIALEHLRFKSTLLLSVTENSLIFTLITMVCWCIRATRVIAYVLTIFGILFAFLCPLTILSELATRAAMPLTDDYLSAADRALGFDWLAYHDWLTARPGLSRLLWFCYQSMGCQVLLLMILLPLIGERRHTERMALTLICGLLITIACGGLFPAIGSNYYYLQADPAGTASLIEAVRAGQHLSSTLDDFKGTITFPSYHTIAAFAIMLAARPLRFLGWIFIIINGTALLGIPLHGSHYLVDCIAGAAIAWGLNWLLCRLHANRSDQPHPRSGFAFPRDVLQADPCTGESQQGW